jgi:hypothetical protein
VDARLEARVFAPRELDVCVVVRPKKIQTKEKSASTQTVEKIKKGKNSKLAQQKNRLSALQGTKASSS